MLKTKTKNAKLTQRQSQDEFYMFDVCFRCSCHTPRYVVVAGVGGTTRTRPRCRSLVTVRLHVNSDTIRQQKFLSAFRGCCHRVTIPVTRTVVVAPPPYASPRATICQGTPTVITRSEDTEWFGHPAVRKGPLADVSLHQTARNSLFCTLHKILPARPPAWRRPSRVTRVALLV